MSVAEMERRFYELKGKLDVGAISEDEFKAEIEKLRFQDAQNRWWMIGAQSGKWYVYDGVRWIPGTPPAEAALPPMPPLPAADKGPAADVQPMPVARPQPAESVETLEPAPAAPSRLERRRARRSPMQLPVRGPFLIGCAALVALAVLVLFWVAVDNLVPGRPISNLWSGRRSGAATPTRPAGQPVAASGNFVQLMAAGDQFTAKSLFDPAIAQYQSASQLAPANSLPLVRWSRALALQGRLQDAFSKAQQATQRTPSDAEAQAQLARVMTWMGQAGDALPIGEKAAQLDPKSANARAYLAEIYLTLQLPAKAQEEARAALQLAPQSAEAHRAQAWVLTLTGQKEAALSEWNQAVALEPELFFRHFELAEVNRLYYGNPTAAAAGFEKAIGLYGAYIPAYSRLGLALLAGGQPAAAVPHFRRAITLDPSYADGYSYLGLAYGSANDCPQAIPYLEQALRLNANSELAARGLNDCKAGKTPAAPAPAAPTGPLVPPTVAAPAVTAPPGAPPTGAPPTLPPPTRPATPASSTSAPGTSPPGALMPTPSARPNPSGRLIFSVFDANARTLALFQASPDGGGRTRIAEDANSASARSDGALVAFTSWGSDRRGIWTMGLDGGNRLRLTDRNEHILPSFSPDGQSFVFASRAGPGELANRLSTILVGSTGALNKDGDLRVLGDGQAPTWGPGGRIAYKPCGRGGCGLGVMNADGTGAATLANFADITVPAWSPDGSKIVVGARTNGEAWNLYLIDVAQGTALQLTNQLATDGPAAFSPDGKTLAFLSSRNNAWAIWEMNADGSNLRKAFDLGGAPAGPVRQEPEAQSGQVWSEQRIVWIK